jgi:hypothetical protein
VNLFFGDKADVEVIIESGFVIQCITKIIEDELGNESLGTFDIRMITLIYFACGNLASTGTQYSSVLVD